MSESSNVVHLTDVSDSPGHWGPWDAMDEALDGMLATGHIRTLLVSYVDVDGGVSTIRAGTDAAITLLAQKVAQSELDSYSFGPSQMLRRAPEPTDDLPDEVA